jgi:hypothetical protein
VTCFAGVDAGGDTFRLRMWQVLRSHIALGESRYGGHGHVLLVKIWSRPPTARWHYA